MRIFFGVLNVAVDVIFTGFCIYQMFHAGANPEHTWVLWFAASFVFLDQFTKDVDKLVK